MYYPYLRGKQFELILVRDNAEILTANHFHPIIEPVKDDFIALIRAMVELNKHNTLCTLIVNPIAGQNPVVIKELLALIDNSFNKFNNISVGYILDPKSSIGELIGLLNLLKERTFSIIHYGYTDGQSLSKEISGFNNISRHIFIANHTGKLYQRHLKRDGVDRILVRDGFNSKKRNKDYPQNEHFSDLHITYSDEGMDGFGDFLIVGDDYSESGGPAFAVAIHLTYLAADNDMYIYHFVSDQTETKTDPGGKFLEALTKLVREIRKPNSTIFRSRACEEFCSLFDKQHFPGLGSVKKLSMQHHIELMAYYFKELV